VASLDCRAIGLAERGQPADAQRPVVKGKHCVEDAAVKMNVLVECIAEPMNGADGAETSVRRRTGTALDQFLLQSSQQDPQTCVTATGAVCQCGVDSGLSAKNSVGQAGRASVTRWRPPWTDPFSATAPIPSPTPSVLSIE